MENLNQYLIELPSWTGFVALILIILILTFIIHFIVGQGFTKEELDKIYKKRNSWTRK